MLLRFGRPLFDDNEFPVDLDVLEQRSFGSGVTMHRYAIRDGSISGADDIGSFTIQ